MSTIPGTAKELKEGRYVVIDGEPCKVVEVRVSSPGKHGAAKIRIVGIGIFDNVKRVLLKPADGDVEIPIVERKQAQVISILGEVAQVMDQKTYEMYEIIIPEDLRGKVKEGDNVEVIESMGKKAIERIR
ncbi:MAG: translation initiation factor IF-5A [Candidatus Micrarchaeia archaeon]